MAEYEIDGRKYLVDEDGFLQVPEKWTEQTAKDLALSEGIKELTESHWKLINYIRDYYDKFGLAPTLGRLKRQSGFSIEDVYVLFPSGPGKGLCKVAGLPKPAGCV
jgi:tRNA 2-thiouridine synthesizing protein E